MEPKKISKEEYERLDLKASLEYSSITNYRCSTNDCNAVDIVSDSTKPPFDFIYANEVQVDGELRLRFVPIKSVCVKCMVVMDVVDASYYRTDTEKYRINPKKAKGDRGRHFYKDFSNSQAKFEADPEVGKDATTMTKQEQEKYKKRFSNL